MDPELRARFQRTKEGILTGETKPDQKSPEPADCAAGSGNSSPVGGEVAGVPPPEGAQPAPSGEAITPVPPTDPAPPPITLDHLPEGE